MPTAQKQIEDIPVTISVPGSNQPPIETSVKKIQEATKALNANKVAPKRGKAEQARAKIQAKKEQATANKNAAEATSAAVVDKGGVAGTRLLAFIERVERLEEEKAALLEDIKEIYAELKGVGFDAPTTRKIVKLRKMDSEKRSEEQQLLDLYMSAIGMQGTMDV